jgi:hypothetical protein
LGFCCEVAAIAVSAGPICLIGVCLPLHQVSISIHSEAQSVAQMPAEIDGIALVEFKRSYNSSIKT